MPRIYGMECHIYIWILGAIGTAIASKAIRVRALRSPPPRLVYLQNTEAFQKGGWVGGREEEREGGPRDSLTSELKTK
jgi:hypothetical protein